MKAGGVGNLKITWAKQQGLSHSELHSKSLCREIKREDKNGKGKERNQENCSLSNLQIPEFCVLEKPVKCGSA